MARYTGPKARINRRLGAMIYENGGAVRAMERRDNPPGMHTRKAWVEQKRCGRYPARMAGAGSWPARAG